MDNEISDKASMIRVTSVKTIPAGNKGYVKIESNMGVTGWGEINNMETNVACSLAESLGELIIDGIDTTVPLFEELLNEDDIVNGDYNIHWLEKWLDSRFK